MIYQVDAGTLNPVGALNGILSELIGQVTSSPLNYVAKYVVNTFDDISDPNYDYATTWTQLHDAIVSWQMGSFLNDDNTDLFGMELQYTDGNPQLNAQAQYNGNISMMKWRNKSTANSGNATAEKAYGFEYDNLSRLKNANYGEIGLNANNQPTWSANVGRYDESGINYDRNGNITALVRNGMIGGTAQAPTFGTMDNLVYSYIGNQLKQVVDAQTATAQPLQFVPASNPLTDYLYDPNGNMTTDPHKGITIQYNYLNLPSTVTFPNSDQLQIIYNANGKLLKRIYQQGANTTTKEYRGKFEFENNILSAYNHDEGRLTPKTGGGYNLEYYLKDHLFSNRIIFADMNVNGSINAATKILEENTYYPYGLEQSGLMNTISSNASPYQYSGKEMLTFNGYNMNDYGARYYDAALGRWNVMDELSEKYHSFSCYNFVVNNPMKYVDPNGKELMLHGGATEMNKFAAIMNKKLGSNMVVVTNGKVTLNGNSSKLKGGALSLYNSLNGVITNEKTTDVILLSEANRSKAFGGGWNKGEINSKSVNIVDVYDAEALDNAKVKLSGAGLLLHEIIETFEHQVNGENDFKKAHSIALKSQGDVDDVSNLENEAIDYNKDNIVDKIESTFTFAGTTWTVTYKFEKNNIVGATISYKPLPIIDKPKEKYVSKNNPLWR